MGYPRAALEAFTKHLVPALPNGTKFRFVLTSGAAIISDQKRWVLPPLRPLQQLVSSQQAYQAHPLTPRRVS